MLPAQAVTKHVSITGLDDFEISAQELQDYWGSLLSPLDLDLELVYDDDTTHDGDISIIFAAGACPANDWFGTREWTFYKYADIVGPYQFVIPYKIQVVKLYKECFYNYDDTNRRRAIINAVTHELTIHALTGDQTHISHIPGKMDKPLGGIHLSTDKLYWIWADKRRLLKVFGKHGTLVKFNEEDVGKVCYFIYENPAKSFSELITGTEMHVDYMPKGKKRREIR